MSQVELPDMPEHETVTPSQDMFGGDDRMDDRRYVAYKRRRAWFLQLKESIGCQVCGHTDPYALDFHHIDPTTKSFPAGTMSISRNRSVFINELAKCALVCTNCHRAIHAGTIPNDLEPVSRRLLWGMPH